MTTGDLAEILEARYAIMETFYEKYEDDIGRMIEDALQDKMDNLQMGGPVDASMILAEGELSAIEQRFRSFLDNEEMNGRAGVPTAAALAGVNHRLLHPYAQANPQRPSFIDTGIYQSSMRAWVDDA